MRLLEKPETVVVSRKPVIGMDHSELKEGQRTSLPPQEHPSNAPPQPPQQQQQIQWSQQQQQHQHQQRSQIYQLVASQQQQQHPQQHQHQHPQHQQHPHHHQHPQHQQPHFSQQAAAPRTAAGYAPPPAATDLPPNMPPTGAAMMPRPVQDAVEYHAQATAAGGPAAAPLYSMHGGGGAATAATHYGGYAQRQYPPPAATAQHHQQQHPQMYATHPQPPMTVQHTQYAQQPRMGMPLMDHPHAPQQPPPPPPQQPYIQPRVGRLPADRPLMKLSVSLIDTYKHINTVYYEERDARRARAKEKQKGQGSHNHGWDDENYDYIITSGELFYGRYRIKKRIGKGSFGQVVQAEDTELHKDVAIKIIKSKKPFLIQAKTEIELLTHLNEKDPDDQHNIVRLLTHFMYRNHQCLVFEMLSLNLYELLKNTQFGGVSLQLIRKFAKQVLKALSFLARKGDVDIIHCDLKPENILLRHPKKSGVKVIDFGSSCKSNKRMYSYIQSRFYRSPEVMLGLPYSVAIDMWSLGCILAEMHTGEPLFSGSDQFDQMQKIVKLLGLVPIKMLEQSSDQHRLQFFERIKSPSGRDEWTIRQISPSATRSSQPKQIIVPSTDPVASLTEVISGNNHRKKKYPPSEARNTAHSYDLFIDLIYRMLSYDPSERIKPDEALNHPFITAGDTPQQSPYGSTSRR